MGQSTSSTRICRDKFPVLGKRVGSRNRWQATWQFPNDISTL